MHWVVRFAVMLANPGHPLLILVPRLDVCLALVLLAEVDHTVLTVG